MGGSDDGVVFSGRDDVLDDEGDARAEWLPPLPAPPPTSNVFGVCCRCDGAPFGVYDDAAAAAAAVAAAWAAAAACAAWAALCSACCGSSGWPCSCGCIDGLPAADINDVRAG